MDISIERGLLTYGIMFLNVGIVRIIADKIELLSEIDKNGKWHDEISTYYKGGLITVIELTNKYGMSLNDVIIDKKLKIVETDITDEWRLKTLKNVG